MSYTLILPFNEDCRLSSFIYSLGKFLISTPTEILKYICLLNVVVPPTLILIYFSLISSRMNSYNFSMYTLVGLKLQTSFGSLSSSNGVIESNFYPFGIIPSSQILLYLLVLHCICWMPFYYHLYLVHNTIQ